ncbi:MAG: AmmeMemoRadiSam system protein A [Bacteroidetes bacterium]|nr:AmmeMemoRadiSam system protein A [Bacteroidota bacterium]
MLLTLSIAERTRILHAAEQAVADAVTGSAPAPSSPLPEIAISGLFVTVHVNGALRGCIGFLAMQGSFEETLREAARRAVTEDYRFLPVEKEELPDCTVDVTLLGPLELLRDPTDFDIGKHGLVLESHGRRGLLLPQVAVEHHWNKTQFLEGLCRKTMVDSDAWKKPETRIFRFEGMIIRASDVEADNAASSNTPLTDKEEHGT